MTDETTEQSAEERIAAKFGFPGQTQTGPEVITTPETTVEEAEPTTADIEWDGEKYTVPLKLKDAFMRNEDYTRKTQELADQRRVLDQNRELMTRAQLDGQFQESVADEVRQLSVIDAYLSQASKLDWRNMSMEQMFKQRLEIDQVKEQRVAIKESIDGKRVKHQEEMKSKLSELRAKSRELAAKSIPNFSEETEKSIRGYAASEGLSDAEIDNVLLDPRSAKVLWKASQFDKVRAGTAKAVEATTKVVRPGATSEKMPEAVRAKLDMRKAMAKAETSGDKARIIEERLTRSSIFNKGH
jgi:hypothetical protein